MLPNSMAAKGEAAGVAMAQDRTNMLMRAAMGAEFAPTVRQ